MARILVVALLVIGHMASSSPLQCCHALPPPLPTSSSSQPKSPLPPADTVVRFEEDRLTIKAHAVPLVKILESVARETGVAFFLKGSPETPVTADFEDSSLEVGIKRLIRGLNNVSYYGPRKPGAKDIQLTSVLVISNPDSRTISAIRSSDDENPGQDSGAMSFEKLVEDFERFEEVASTDDNAFYELVDILEIDANPERRLAAVEALGSFEKPEVEPMLFSRALSDDDAEVRAAAVEALGSIATKDTIDYLAEALKDENANVRTAAVETLALVGGKDAADVLIMAIKDEDSQVRAAAVEMLADIGGKKAADALTEVLGDEDEEIRENAKEALSVISLAK